METPAASDVEDDWINEDCDDALAHATLNRIRRRRKNRSANREFLSRRCTHESLQTFIDELRSSNNFTRQLRMSKKQFDVLLDFVHDDIAPKYSHGGDAVSARDRLTITLFHWATGISMTSLQTVCRVSKQRISYFVRIVTDAIIKRLTPLYMELPTTTAQWKAIADRFEQRWNFPHTLGAIDGMHVEIAGWQASGSLYWNFKVSNSILLMAIVDADHRFIHIDVGANGRAGDSRVFADMPFMRLFNRGSLNIPEAQKLPNTDFTLPYYLIGDGGFPLCENIMIPFGVARSKTSININFNKCLSRCGVFCGVCSETQRCILVCLLKLDRLLGRYESE